MNSLAPRANVTAEMGHVEKFRLIMNVCEVSIADEGRVAIVPHMIDACRRKGERERWRDGEMERWREGERLVML